MDWLRDREGPPPATAQKGALPVPWLLVREAIAEEWRMAPFDIPPLTDREHDLADEVGRWIDVANLKAKYRTS
jgi:hypothetical protein